MTDIQIASSHYAVTHTLLESRVRFLCPQNVSGASEQNGVAAFYETTQIV